MIFITTRKKLYFKVKYLKTNNHNDFPISTDYFLDNFPFCNLTIFLSEECKDKLTLLTGIFSKISKLSFVEHFNLSILLNNRSRIENGILSLSSWKQAIIIIFLYLRIRHWSFSKWLLQLKEVLSYESAVLSLWQCTTLN